MIEECDFCDGIGLVQTSVGNFPCPKCTDEDNSTKEIQHMSEHLMNSTGAKTFSRLQTRVIKVALTYLKNDFDEEDLETLGYTDDQLNKKIDQILWKINN